MRVSIEPLVVLVLAVKRGKRFLTVSEVSRSLGVSKRTAGRLLAHLCRQGYVERWSRTTYRIKPGTLERLASSAAPWA
ncbi:MAG: helix-turn-helix domain-containing protein [Crenarchaeota archaeon]|nr:helix-turn-helix domain-containing protein [Thermoproteota archaeon]